MGYLSVYSYSPLSPLYSTLQASCSHFMKFLLFSGVNLCRLQKRDCNGMVFIVVTSTMMTARGATNKTCKGENLGQTETAHGWALKNIEGSPVLWNCEIQGAQHMLLYEKKNLLVAQEQKQSARGSPDATRAQPCSSKIGKRSFSSLTQ